MSLKSINAKLAKAGHSNVELERGDGYLYFIFDDRGPNYETESVMTPYLKTYTDKEWFDMGVEYAKRMEERVKEREEVGAGFRGGPFGALNAMKRV